MVIHADNVVIGMYWKVFAQAQNRDIVVMQISMIGGGRIGRVDRLKAPKQISKRSKHTHTWCLCACVVVFACALL